MDKISLPIAINTDMWAFVWAAEPTRMVQVEMTYDDLWNIVQRKRNDRLEVNDAVHGN